MANEGLQGDLRETCVVCLMPTDTALGLTGEAEWIIVALMKMGMPQEDAFALIAPDNTVLVGPMEMVFQVCAACAAKAKMTVAVTRLGTLPQYGQRRAP